MSQSKPKVVKVHSSKSSTEKLSSDFQGTKQKLKTPKRASNKPARKPSPQGNRKQGNTVEGVANVVEDASSKAEVARMNLKTLQNIDGGITKILCTIPHVELYQYKGTSNMWERTTYEGTLFVYLRESAAKVGRGFMILNRLNSENTQETLTSGMEFRKQSPFLLYKRDSSGEIFGLCIKDEQNFSQAGKLLNRLTSESTSPVSYDVSSSISPSPNTTGGSQSPVSRSEGPPASSEESARGGIQSRGGLDLQEVANHAYLGGQCFSDDTEGSIEGAESSSSPSGASDKENLPRRQIGVNSGNNGTGLANSVNNVASNGITYGQPVHSFPQQIPAATAPVSSHASPVADKNPSMVRANQSRTPDFKQTANKNITSPSPHSNHSMMHHATSLDEGRRHGFNQYGRSPTLGHLSNGFSSSMNESSLRSMQRREYSRPGNSAAVNINAIPEGSRPHDESIVRKLFSTSVPSAAAPEPVMPAKDISPAVLTFFSRANSRQDPASSSERTPPPMPTSYLSSSLGASPHMPDPTSQKMLRSSALSLDEVEKQMNVEGIGAWPPATTTTTTIATAHKAVPQAANVSGKTGGQVHSVSTSVYSSNVGMIPLSAMTTARNLPPSSHHTPTYPMASHSIPPPQYGSSHFPQLPHPLPSHLPPPTHPVPSQLPPPTHPVPSQFPPPTHPVPSQLPPPTHPVPSQFPPPTHPVLSQLPPPTHQVPPPTHSTQPVEDARLIQPSAFSISSAAAAMASTSSAASTSHSILLPSSIPNASAITVEPPTPVAIPPKVSPELGGFPSIPPLMHSPGMMAPPMSRSTGSKSSVKKAGSESGSLTKRSASADSDAASCVWNHLSPEEMPPSQQSAAAAAPRRSLTTPTNTTLMSPQQFLECRASGPSAVNRDHHIADPVTKDQFQKALMYLMQNDKSFMDKIYETHKALMQSSAQHQ